MAKIESTIAGIPCIVGVTHYLSVKGSLSYNAPSDVDYYGYTDCEWDVLDRKGRKAEWLERKLTDDDADRIEQEIIESMRDWE